MDGIQHVSPRAALIAELADDIKTGTPSGPYRASFFLSTLRDRDRVTSDDVEVLLCLNEHTDAHIDVADRLREIVESEALKFFRDDPLGIEHVDELMAARDREAREDAETISELAA